MDSLDDDGGVVVSAVRRRRWWRQWWVAAAPRVVAGDAQATAARLEALENQLDAVGHEVEAIERTLGVHPEGRPGGTVAQRLRRIEMALGAVARPHPGAGA